MAWTSVPTPFISAQRLSELPLPCVTVCHHISTGLYLLLLNFHIECVDCVDDAVHCAFFPHINSKNIVLEKKRLTGF